MVRGYSTTVSTGVTFNPYLPLPGRLLEVLLSYGPAGTTIETCNRDLARAAQCSAGAVPGALRTLEADGHIERVTTARGSLIVVTNRSGMADRSFSASTSDQRIIDRSDAAEAAEALETPDRSGAAALDRSAMADPPLHPPIRYKHESPEQQLGARASLYQAIVGAGGAAVVEQILAANPDLTLAEFEAMCHAAKRRGSHRSRDSIGLVFWCLQNRQPLHTPKESEYERPQRRYHAPNHARRSALSSPRQQPPPLSREEFRKLPTRGELRRLRGVGAAADG